MRNGKSATQAGVRQALESFGFTLNIDDEISKSLLEVWRPGKVSVHSVFAGQLALNITEICGSVFHKQLTEASTSARKVFEFKINETSSGPQLDTGNGNCRWPQQSTPLMLQIYDLIDRDMDLMASKLFPSLKEDMVKRNTAQSFSMFDGSGAKDMPPEMREALQERCPGMKMGERSEMPIEMQNLLKNMNISEMMIAPNDDGSFVYLNNPLLSGKLVLKLAVLQEEAGIDLANHHMSIMAVAHLYNALRKLQLTSIEWPEMERIIELHSQALFANDIPDDPEAMFHRYNYRLRGAGEGSRQPKAYANDGRWRMHPGLASQTLKTMLTGQVNVETALAKLEGQVQDRSGSSKELKSTQRRRRAMTPLQLMSKFETFLDTVSKDLELDYITLTKTCNGLMKKIREEMEKRFGAGYKSRAEPGQSNDPAYSITVWLLLADNSPLHSCPECDRERRKYNNPMRQDGGGEQLRAAREVFDEFFSTNACLLR